jgi:hypothetical protein
MYSVLQLKRLTPQLIIALVLAYCAHLPTAQAVVPPPDGGYPGFNTAEGDKALFGLSTGVANTAVGWYSLYSDTEGSFKHCCGRGSAALQHRSPIWRR